MYPFVNPSDLAIEMIVYISLGDLWVSHKYEPLFSACLKVLATRLEELESRDRSSQYHF
jgi:hypothetical protein